MEKVKKYDDTATVIANVFKKDVSYIRKIIADTGHVRYKGKKPMQIRRAYLQYKYSKERIIQKLQQSIQQQAA